MKINDVRILRNIIGDKDFDNDNQGDVLKRKLPKFVVPKLNLGKLPKRDMYGKNLEEYSFKTKTDTYIPETENKETVSVLMGDETDQEIMDTNKEIREIKKQKALETSKKELEELRNPDPRTEQIAEMKKQQDYLQAIAVQRALAPTRKEPLSKTRSFNIPFTNKKFETNVPTTEGVYRGYERFSKNVAAPLTKNLSYAGMSNLIGSFGDEASGKNLTGALKNKRDYEAYLINKYQRKGYKINSAADLYSIINMNERKKLSNLGEAAQSAQTLVTSKGFLSGQGGRSILGRSVTQGRSANLGLTQVGSSRPITTNFGAEALSRLGVTQSLTSASPTTRMEALFPEKLNTVSRLTEVIGKGPDAGYEAHPYQKLSKYIKVNDSKKRSINYKDKIKQFM